ncbi:MAG: hypothetical protein KGI49_01620 [Patescibacteria group bacterium]|nr:hypothetical protein [Patescibacteria group bacterium]
MAILNSENLKANLSFSRPPEYGGYVNYVLKLLYKDRPAFNPETFPLQSIEFDEYGKDSLIPFIEGVLKDGRPDSWLPLEHDIYIKITPSNDSFDVFFELANMSVGSGLSATLSVDRIELEKFVNDLRREYHGLYLSRL